MVVRRTSPPVLAAGLDGRSLLLESPVLRRTGYVVEERASARGLLETVLEGGTRLVVLGSLLPDMSITDVIRRLRSTLATRHVSVLVLITQTDPPDTERLAVMAGANAALRRPLDTVRLDLWMAKLLSVPRRVEARIPVQGQVIGTPRSIPGGHFFGLSRNLSVNGMLLASPTPLLDRPEVELEFTLPEGATYLRALGRVVRDAGEIGWPYLGYGVEFLFVPPDSLEAIARLVTGRKILTARRLPSIHSTVRRDVWIYEILEPVPHSEGWQSEIRRAPREDWRPGRSGPFYVVEGRSREETLAEARAFVHRQG